MIVVVAASDLFVLMDEDVFGDPFVSVSIEVFIDPIDQAATR